MPYSVKTIDASEDILNIVKIHQSAFQGFFLTSLGDDFLKTYYSSCLRNKRTIAVGLYNDRNILIGYAFGNDISRSFHKRILIDNIVSFALSLSKKILFDPRILFRLVYTLNIQANDQKDNSYGELLSLAIHSDFRGLGLGSILISSYESQARKLGVKSVSLTTDYDNNDSVIQFYFKHGYEVLYDFSAYNRRKMYRLIKEI